MKQRWESRSNRIEKGELVRGVEKIIVLLLLAVAIVIPACAQKETGPIHGMIQETPDGSVVVVK